MNYNNPNSSGAPFPYQYGSSAPNSMPPPPQGQAYGMPPPSASGGAGYPNLSGVGQPQYGMQQQYPQQQYPAGGYAGGGYASQPPSQQPYQQQPPYGAGYQQPYQQHVNQQQYRPSYTAPFDERAYLQKMFNEIDSNRDGRITGQELHEALRRGQPTSEFDPYTIQALIQKYDSDRDNQISFMEFSSLFGHLNTQLNEFYDFDSDNSGSIDGRELGNILRRKGYNFSPDLFNYIVYEISRRSGKPGVTFDTYVRLIARFDFLKDTYQRTPQLQQSVQLEKYIRDSFF